MKISLISLIIIVLIFLLLILVKIFVKWCVVLNCLKLILGCGVCLIFEIV